MRDSKHPKRWRPTYFFREGKTFGNSGLKEAIYEACDLRGDSQSEQVRVRMAGVLIDPHSADVRYHVDCRASFMCSRSIQAALRQSSSSTSTNQLTDRAFDSDTAYVADNKDAIFNSVDLYNKYVQEGGNVLSRQRLVKNLLKKFKNDMIALSSPGISTILVFKSTAAKAFHMTPDDTDDMHEIIDMVSTKNKAEINNIEIDRKNYCGHVNRDICLYYQSNTLNDILTKVSKKLNQSIP